MSEVNLQFTVNEFSTAFTANTNEISFNPVPTELSIYTGYTTFAPGGSANSDQVLYNFSGAVQSNINFTYTQSTSTLEVVNLIVNSDTNLGAVGNVTITGGNAGQYLTTNGSGDLSFTTLTPGGNAGQLQYNNAGVFAGVPNVLFTASNLSLGNIANVKIGGGFNNYVAATDGAGNLSFTNVIPANGSPYTLQFNNSGILDGIPFTLYDAGSGKLSLGSTSNIEISGGTNGYVLQTDGTGNLTWTAQSGGSGNGSPGGANTQVQYNDAGVFGGDAGFTYDASTDTMAVVNANVGNVKTNNLLYANGTAWNFVTPAGGANTEIQFNNSGAFQGNSYLTFNNSTLTLNAPNVNITGTTTLQQGREKTTELTTTSGSVNFDYLNNGAILYASGNLSGNISLNVRGNSTTTFLSTINNFQTVNLVVVTQVGAAPYYINNFAIDGVTKTVKWASNVAPSITTIYTYSSTCFTYTITRTTLDNYVILGTFTGYV
jgi:hypothetical protein